jgi:hypothetical protein
MTFNDYSYEDAVAAIRLIYDALSAKKKADLSSYLIDLLCYLRLTSPPPVQRISPSGPGTVVAKQ